MLATYYTLSKDNAPVPEEMRQKSREYMLMKPKSTHNQKAGTCKGGASHKGRHGTSLETTWTNIGLVQLWISGSSCGGLHDIQAGHEELGIRTGRRGHESNGGT